MSSTVVRVLGVVLALICSVSSQTTDANCSASFSWSNNDRRQDICEITAYLRSACLADPSDAFVQALPGPTYFYVQPNKPDNCTCSMVYYNTISACALCQGGTTTPWSGYISNCTTDDVLVTVASFPNNIPPGTDVPAWAYLNVSLADVFNATAAETYSTVNSTMIVGTTPPTPSSTSSSASSTIFFSTGTSAPDQPSASSTTTAGTSASKKSNAGAIAGGVVGGVAGAVLLAGLLLWWLRRPVQRRPTMSDAEPTLVDPLSPPVSPAPLPTGSVGKLYNPDDPTTFPGMHSPPSMGYAYGRNSPVASTGASQPMGYTGTAEL